MIFKNKFDFFFWNFLWSFMRNNWKHGEWLRNICAQVHKSVEKTVLKLSFQMEFHSLKTIKNCLDDLFSETGFYSYKFLEV